MCFQTYYVSQALVCASISSPKLESTSKVLLKVRGPHVTALCDLLVRSSDEAATQQTLVMLVRKSRGHEPCSICLNNHNSFSKRKIGTKHLSLRI